MTPGSVPRSTLEPGRPTAVVLDFDGTLTDADAHAADFHEASRRELASRLGWDESTLGREWQRARERLLALPPETPWIVDGRGVCPATADPYLIANGVAKRVLTEHRPGLGGAAIAAAVLEVHHAAYERVPPPFRLDAAALLDELCARGLAVRVVTNSRTGTVERRLDELSLRARRDVVVRGEAGKFTVGASACADARFEALPECLEWEGVGRAVHLRRGAYFDLLRGIWDETGTRPESTLVVGDVFELDLAMPAALGAHVHLALRASTLVHERRLAEATPRGGASASLAAVLERLPA